MIKTFPFEPLQFPLLPQQTPLSSQLRMCLSTSCVEGSGIIAVKYSGPQGAHSGGAQGRHAKKSDCNSAPIDARTLFLRLRYSPEVLILFLLHQLPHLLHFQSLSMSLEQGSSKLQPTSQILTSACFVCGFFCK